MTEATQTSSYIYEVPVNKLKSYERQPRHHFDDKALEGLKENILKNGIVTPLLVSREHEILSGERRFLAAKSAEMDTVPVIYKEDNIYEIAVLDNIMREDLTAVEKAEALKDLYEQQKEEDDSIGDGDFGKAYSFKKSSISEYFSIANMDEAIKKLFRDEPEAALRRLKKIASIKDPEKQLAEAKKFKETLEEKERKRSTKPEAAVKKIDDFLKHIEKVTEDKQNFFNWEKDEQQTYIDKLKMLESQLTNLLKKVDSEPEKHGNE